MAEDGEELIVLLQRRPARRPGAAASGRARCLGQVQTDRRHAAGDRAADVEQIRIAFGAGADHRVRERDRVRFAPRDLLAERRPHVRLVRRAGPGRHRAHAFVGEHLPRRLRRPLRRHRPVLPAAFVDAADVQAGRHRDARAERREPLGELERRVAEVDGAVDVRLRDVHQRGRAVDVGHPHEDRHRELRRPGPRSPSSIARSRDRVSIRDTALVNYNAAHATQPIRARRCAGRGRAASSPAAAQTRAQPPPITILKPARVFDGDAMHEGWAVRVKGDRIDAVGSADDASPPPARGSSTCRARR